MPVSRRNMILYGGSGLALAAIGGVWRVTRLPSVSGPWRFDPAPLADVRLDAFRHAILAPNPHNRQPWQIRLAGDSEAMVTCDLARRLPETDPFDRQIVIGFGAFLELAGIAARERGFRADIEAFPEGEPQPRLDARPVARIRFVRDAAAGKDPLYAMISARRSAKVPYDMARPPGPEALERLIAAAGPGMRISAAASAAETEALRALIWEGFQVETATPRTYRESIDLLRVGSTEIERNPDGIALKGPLFEALSLLGGDAVRAQALDLNSSAAKSTLARYKSTFEQTPAFLWITASSNTRADQIAAGRAWVRANLTAASLGLSVAPVSQVLQEFPEMQQLFARAHRLLGAKPGETVQMLARLGYGPAVEPSGRWPLDAKIVRA